MAAAGFPARFGMFARLQVQQRLGRWDLLGISELQAHALSANLSGRRDQIVGSKGTR
jgi:hypothetical protein